MITFSCKPTFCLDMMIPVKHSGIFTPLVTQLASKTRIKLSIWPVHKFVRIFGYSENAHELME